MTDDIKKERMIEFLTESHLYLYGGYPYGYAECCDVVYVAELDDAKERNRTVIKEYAVADLLSWYDRAAEYIAVQPDLVDAWHPYTSASFGDWEEVFGETVEP